MGVALSIVILFTISTTIVRVAAVFLEHSGLPRHIARMQAMSALSGAGFTTSESELILQTPERRRILTVLIITGTVGISSVVATSVVGATSVDDTIKGFIVQVALIAVAVAFVRYVLFSTAFDNLICGLAHSWLERQNAEPDYDILCMLNTGHVLGAHTPLHPVPANQGEWGIDALLPMGIRPAILDAPIRPWTGETLQDGEALLLAGPTEAHKSFVTAYGTQRTKSEH